MKRQLGFGVGILIVTLWAATPVLADDHGNAFGTATSVALGSATAGSIETAGDVDYFRFVCGATAKYVIFSRGSADVSAFLYNETYAQVASDSNDGNLNNFRIEGILIPGTYYVKVTGASSTSTTGSYELHVEGPGAGSPKPPSDDHGESPWSATAVNVGSARSGSIELTGDKDFFAFTVAGTAKYVIFTRGRTDVTGYLYDQSYEPISVDGNDGELDNFRIERILTPGTYFLAVSGASSTSTTGSYELHIEGPGAASPKPASDDHGESPWSATAVSVGSAKSGSIELAGDKDFFAFRVAGTGKFVIFSRGTTDVTGYLYDQSYEPITSDGNDGELDNFRIEVNLTPGTYFLAVSGSSSTSTTGSYELHVEGPGAGSPTPSSDDHGESPWSATGIAVNGTRNGNLEIFGDKDFFRFSVPATAVFTVYSQGSTDTTGRLFDQDYNLLATDYSDGDLNNFRFEGTLAPGTYYLEVTGSSSTSTYGPYSVVVAGPPDSLSPTLAVTSHLDGMLVRTASIVLAGRASDAGRGENGVQSVTVNGVRAGGDTAVGDGVATWSMPVTLSRGANAIVVIATDNSAAHNQSGLALIIYYDNPVELWSRTFNGTANADDRAQGVAVSGSDVYVAGTTSVAGQGSDIWLRKYSSAGDAFWTRTFNGRANKNDWAAGVAVSLDGYVYVAGTTQVGGHGTDVWVRKYKATGDTVWTRTYNGTASSDDSASAVAVARDGSVYVSGSTTVPRQGLNIWLRKYTPAGAVVWTRTYNSLANGADTGGGLAIAADGTVYQCGTVVIQGQGTNLWFRRYSAKGAVIWTRLYNGAANLNDLASDVAVGSDGAVYLAGSLGTNSKGYDLFLSRFSPAGEVVWSQTSNGSADGDDHGLGVTVSAAGEVFLAGATTVPGSGLDLLQEKYLSDGTYVWGLVYDGTAGADDTFQDVAVAPDGSIYFVGYTTEIGHGADIRVTKIRLE